MRDVDGRLERAGSATGANAGGSAGRRVLPLKVAGAPAPRGAGAGASGLTQLPPLSLYVHLPWCVRKCPYCDFNSHELRGTETLAEDAERAYVDSLQSDLESALPLVWGRSVQTVFFGGGTPSLFSPGAIERLLEIVRARLRLAPDAEITMEANPGTFEVGRFRDFASAGVNRLSIGVQSFDDRLLAALGRIHDGGQARRAIETAAERFASFNIDLMYALPGQDMDDLDRDLRIALSFAPPHLSYYQLALEPNTLFAKYPPQLPDEDLAAEMQERIECATATAGLEHYEISAYARRGHRARHNLNYWEFGDYLGIGAGAHGKLSFHDRIIRQARLKHPQRYVEQAMRGAALEQERALGPADLPFEFMLNVLRLVGGVPAAMFEERTGLPISAVSRRLGIAAQRGLLDPDPTVIRPTSLGLRFLNDLQQLFLEEAS